MLIVPITAIYYVGGVGPTIARLNAISPNYFSLIKGADGSVLSLTAIVSLLAWGFGYFGQPHILVRFMAIENPPGNQAGYPHRHDLVVISLFMSVMVGLAGRVYLGPILQGSAAETCSSN